MGDEILAPPDEFLCPITRELMENPVVAADGFTYERSAITLWLQKGHHKSPMTNERLPHKLLIPNFILRRMISNFKGELPPSQRKIQTNIQEATRFKEEIMKQAIDINNGRVRRLEYALNEERNRIEKLTNKIEELSRRVSINIEQIPDESSDQENTRSYSIIFKLKEDRWFSLQIEPSNSIAQVKRKIFEKKGFPEICQKLIFKGVELLDENLMCEYEIYDNDMIYLCLEEWSRSIENYLIYIKNLKGKVYEFEVSPDESIKSLKLKIQDVEGSKAESQRLIYAGKQLEDDWSLHEYNIQSGSTMHLVLALKGC